MWLYRICHAKHLEEFGGHGASYKNGGRWNSPGVPVLYFAESASVAMLEMANYLPSPRQIPPSYRLGVYLVPEDTSILRWAPETLPNGWNAFPYPRWTQEQGSRWLNHGEESLLAVPSVAVPGGLESIVLASPSRLARIAIRLIRALDDIYDRRAFDQ